MPRPTVKVNLICFKCNQEFSINRWEQSNREKRMTRKSFCSAECKNIHQKLGGHDSPNWKGGRRKYPSKNGYVTVWVRSGKRTAEHRLIMENHLGRKLKPSEVVHHLNENTSDNRISNLIVCKNAGEHHQKYHLKKGKNGQFMKALELEAKTYA